MRLWLPVFLLAFSSLALAAPAAMADEPLPPDSVTLTLAAENWVDTSTAKVRVAVDSAMESDAVAAARSRIKTTLGKLLPNADWHITSFNRSRDASGLERWHLEAEARAPETALDGLNDRAKSASHPGEQVTVASITFEPTLAEREKVLAGLRATIYGEVKDEIARLNGVYTDRAFRVRTIDFGGVTPMPLVHPMAVQKAYAPGMAREAASPAAEEAPIGVAQKLQLSARVVLAADPPHPKDKD